MKDTDALLQTTESCVFHSASERYSMFGRSLRISTVICAIKGARVIRHMNTKQPLQLRRGRGLHSPAPAIATALLCSFCGCGRWRCLKTGIRPVLWRCQPPLRYPAPFESKEIQARDMPGRDPWSSRCLCFIASDSRGDFPDLPPFVSFALLDTQ